MKALLYILPAIGIAGCSTSNYDSPRAQADSSRVGPPPYQETETVIDTRAPAPQEQAARTQPERIARPDERGRMEAMETRSRMGQGPALTRASDVLGKTVKDRQGATVGTIEDVGVSLETGRISYAVLQLDTARGAPEKQVAIPPGALRPGAEKNVLRLDADRQTLERAPQFDAATWRGWDETAWGARSTEPDARIEQSQPSRGSPSEVQAGRELPSADTAATAGDREVARHIREAFQRDDSLAPLAKYVEVDVKNGIVTLRGAVSTERTKNQLAQRARNLEGVSEVKNEIEVKGH